MAKELEDFVAGILDKHRYVLVPPARFFPARSLEQPIYSRQLEVGKDIYGKSRRVDFMLYHPRQHPNCLVVQCMWQTEHGTTYQKYPFEVLSIAQNEFDTIIVLDGGGYHVGAKQWLINQSGKNRLLDVFSKDEFSRFAVQRL